MKNQILLVCILLMCFVNGFASIKIEGTIKNPQSKNVTFTVIENWYSDAKSINVALDMANHFIFTYETNSPIRISLLHCEVDSNKNWHEASRFYEWLFEPNDVINMSFDTKDFWKTLKIKGKNASKFNYYIEDFVNADVIENWRNQIEKNQILSISEQFKYLDEVFLLKTNTFNKHKPKFSDTFKAFQENEIKLMINSSKAEPLSRVHPDSLRNFQEQNPVIKAFLENSIPNYTSELLSKDYLYYVDLISNLSFYIKFGTQDFSNLKQYKAGLFDKEIMEAFDAKNLLQMCINGSAHSYIPQFYELFKKDFPESKYINIIDKKMEEVFSTKTIASDFNIKNSVNESVTLSDFKDKVIVMDFWASWCKPCIEDIPAFNKVKESYKDNKEVVFISVSADESEDSWKNALIKYNLSGFQLLANKEILSNYKISAFPTYLLIDKKGVIKTYFLPRPNEQEGKAMIEFIETNLQN